MKTKNTEQKKLKPKKKDVSQSDSIEDLEDDEDYDDEVDSVDKNFIADDEEVYQEQVRAKKLLKKEQGVDKKHKKHNEDEYLLDEDDFDVIKENQPKKRLLKRLNENQDSDNDQIVRQKVKIDDDQIGGRFIKGEDDKFKNEKSIKKQVTEKRDQTTASDDEDKQEIGQHLKDKFITEELDDVFGTYQDQVIVEEDIPERLQIKLANRLSPKDEELAHEAEWIFNIIFDKLEQSKEQSFVTKLEEVKNKIKQCLILFRREKCDVPYITKSRQNELLPELKAEHTWLIFELDIEYGKFLIQKKQCEDFFTKIHELADEKIQNWIQHYKNQIYYINSMRELNDFQQLITFYKSYYHDELNKINEEVGSGRKVPVQKKDFVYTARKQRLDEFCRRCMLHPVQLQENANESKQKYKPINPSIGPTEMGVEYIRQKDEQSLNVIKDMCTFAALELSSEPDIRRGLKKHIYEHGWIKTAPTEKGKKELDVFNPTYRTKHVDKKLSELQNTDLFLEILLNSEKELLTYQINVKDDSPDEKMNKYFFNLSQLYKYPDDQTKWRFLRSEIFSIFTMANSNNKATKTFYQGIMDEIRNELREDAEKYVLRRCAEKYRDMINTCYFVQERNRPSLNERRKPYEEDIIQQRERPVVMGVVMHPIDNRNFIVTAAVVDQFGELVSHKDFLHLIPPRKRPPPRDGQLHIVRPGEEDEQKKHDEDKKNLQEILREQQVDLIVVCADCLEAKKLKKALSEFASVQQQDKMQDDDDQDKSQEKEAYVIWGRPEVPKLFASSHYSQKLLKNHPFVLKKAICLARWEQDPMNEMLNLWSPIISENQSLNLDLHPYQKQINQARLLDKLEEINIQTVNNVGIDINMLIDHEHMQNQLQFLGGLGPRKAQKYIQKLKSLGKPLYTRNEIYETKILQKFCFISCFAQTKVRVPPEKRPEDFQYNILDQTRIHFRQYDTAYKIACDAILTDQQQDIDNFQKQQALIDIIKDPKKLKEFAINEYKEILKQFDKVGYTYLIDQIFEDLMHPFRDPREHSDNVRSIANIDSKFTNRELFYCLIDESDRTFKRGIIVSATVNRVFDSVGQDKPAKIICRLENGLEAIIGEQDADFFAQNGSLQNSIDIGSIITGRVHEIKFGDGKEGKFDDNFCVFLKCKKQDLIRHDRQYIDPSLLNIPEEDLENQNYKAQEEQQQNQKKTQILKRKIQHQRFQNISSAQAIQFLTREDNGEFYFRPSSKGIDNLTLTWKFYGDNIVHIDISEHDKAIGANIGSKLKIGDETYDNLQEIVERYIVPCNRLLREAIQHPKFVKCNSFEEVKKAVESEKTQDNQRIPYHFTVLPKYPQYLILSYIPKKDVVKEFIKVKPRGYFFHHQYHYPFQNMINWFKQEFRSKDYQRYLRKASSPQPASRAEKQPQFNPSNMPMDTGMQIDQVGDKWGADVKREGQRQDYGGWGQDTQQSSQIKDERENRWGDDKQGEWGANNNPSSPTRSDGGFGRGRGRGRGGGSGRNCFKCNQEGHFAKDCPNEGNAGHQSKPGGFGRGRGRGGDRPPNICFNCNQEGHFAKDCTEPRKERERGGFDNPHKRQRQDENGNYGKVDNNEGWGMNKNSGWGNDTQNQANNSQGSGWGNNNTSGAGWQ